MIHLSWRQLWCNFAGPTNSQLVPHRDLEVAVPHDPEVEIRRRPERVVPSVSWVRGTRTARQELACCGMGQTGADPHRLTPAVDPYHDLLGPALSDPDLLG